MAGVPIALPSVISFHFLPDPSNHLPCQHRRPHLHLPLPRSLGPPGRPGGHRFPSGWNPQEADICLLPRLRALAAQAARLPRVGPATALGSAPRLPCSEEL